jgi:hypothetical protein
MIKKWSISLLATLGLMAATFITFDSAEAAEWRGIIPLKSTRAEVEKRLGVKEGDFYKFESERAWIFYSSGNLDGNDCSSKAAKDVVTRISVIPEDELLLKNLNLDLTKFRKVRNPQYPHIVTYINEEDGVDYEVSEASNNDIQHISYYPSRKDCDALLKGRQ